MTRPFSEVVAATGQIRHKTRGTSRHFPKQTALEPIQTRNRHHCSNAHPLSVYSAVNSSSFFLAPAPLSEFPQSEPHPQGAFQGFDAGSARTAPQPKTFSAPSRPKRRHSAFESQRLSRVRGWHRLSSDLNAAISPASPDDCRCCAATRGFHRGATVQRTNSSGNSSSQRSRHLFCHATQSRPVHGPSSHSDTSPGFHSGERKPPTLFLIYLGGDVAAQICEECRHLPSPESPGISREHMVAHSTNRSTHGPAQASQPTGIYTNRQQKSNAPFPLPHRSRR
jgi:hypothetical protein